MRYIRDQICFQPFITHSLIDRPIQTASDFIDHLRNLPLRSAQSFQIDPILKITVCNLFNPFLDPDFRKHTSQNDPKRHSIRRQSNQSHRNIPSQKCKPVEKEKHTDEQNNPPNIVPRIQYFLSECKDRTKQASFPQTLGLDPAYQTHISREKAGERKQPVQKYTSYIKKAYFLYKQHRIKFRHIAHIAVSIISEGVHHIADIIAFKNPSS